MLHSDELNYSNVSQRINALLSLEDQRKVSLESLKRRQQMVKSILTNEQGC
jgi:hypothetical protein